MNVIKFKYHIAVAVVEKLISFKLIQHFIVLRYTLSFNIFWFLSIKSIGHLHWAGTPPHVANVLSCSHGNSILVLIRYY